MVCRRGVACYTHTHIMYLVKILPNNINEIDNTLLMTNGPVETMKFLNTKGYLKLVTIIINRYLKIFMRHCTSIS